MIVLVAFLLGVALGASAGEQNNGVQPMQIVIPILTLLLGVAFSVFLRRPRLQVTGSGSGGGPGPGHHSNRLRVTNQPGLLGIKLKQTVVMGKRIYRDFEKGLTVIRDPAIECRATIHDADDGNRHIAMLWWRPLSDPHAEWDRTVTIQSGETFELACSLGWTTSRRSTSSLSRRASTPYRRVFRATTSSSMTRVGFSSGSSTRTVGRS